MIAQWTLIKLRVCARDAVFTNILKGTYTLGVCESLKGRPVCLQTGPSW